VTVTFGDRHFKAETILKLIGKVGLGKIEGGTLGNASVSRFFGGHLQALSDSKMKTNFDCRWDRLWKQIMSAKHIFERRKDKFFVSRLYKKVSGPFKIEYEELSSMAKTKKKIEKLQQIENLLNDFEASLIDEIYKLN
jgi:hypothetical protein